MSLFHVRDPWGCVIVQAIGSSEVLLGRPLTSAELPPNAGRFNSHAHAPGNALLSQLFSLRLPTTKHSHSPYQSSGSPVNIRSLPCLPSLDRARGIPNIRRRPLLLRHYISAQHLPPLPVIPVSSFSLSTSRLHRVHTTRVLSGLRLEGELIRVR